MYITMPGHGSAENDHREPEWPASFDSILAHDLTNHLFIIEGQADLLLDRLEEPIAVDRLTTIKRQTAAANSLVQTVCGMGDALERGQLDVVDVGSVLRNEVQQIRSAYPGADVSVDVPEGVFARADDLVASVFWNLLQNAVRHNGSPTPRVSVTARSLESKVVVSIEDDGPGLPDDVRRALVGDVTARRGTGVGIVRTLADRYDATISVDGEGEGTTISLEFPGASRSKDS